MIRRDLSAERFPFNTGTGRATGEGPPMKSVVAAAYLFLMSLPVLAAQQNTDVPDAVEPLSTPYLVIIGLIFLGMLVGLYWFYMRWDDDEDKPGAK